VVRQAGHSIAARVLTSAMSMGVLMVAGHRYGAATLGTISLVVLAISLVMLFGSWGAGPAMVYLAPRVPRRRLLKRAYLWALITCVLAYPVLLALPDTLVPEGMVGFVTVLAGLQVCYGSHLHILLGQQRLRAYHLLTTAHATTLLVVFTLLATNGARNGTLAYVHASLVAFGATAVASSVAIYRTGPIVQKVPWQGGVWRALLLHGGWSQLGNTVQLLNNRLVYYLLDLFCGRVGLGVYSVGTQVAEGAWLVPRSLSILLFSRLSNTETPAEQVRLTLATLKLSVFAALVFLGIAWAIPSAWYALLFGPEVVDLKPLLWLLAPGILALSASQALSHYFSGTLRTRHNLAASVAGLLALGVLGWPLVTHHGLRGGAALASAVHCSALAYQMVAFVRHSATPWRALLPGALDLAETRRLWGRLRHR
jgi:O-antigen/teichoic acid export membrane protein